jgi:hypothetical protein
MIEIHEETGSLFTEPILINVGLDMFFQALRSQGVEVIQVDWRPPPATNDDMVNSLLDQIM